MVFCRNSSGWVPSPKRKRGELSSLAYASGSGGQFRTSRLSILRFVRFTEFRVDAVRFLGADQGVAVGVEALEGLVGTEEFAARHVAVPVAVHLAEPLRTLAQVRQRGV